VQGVHFERGCPCAEVYMDGVGWENDRPKKAILGNPGVEIVELRRPSRGVDVNSHEREGALPHVPMSPDVDALHESHMVIVEGRTCCSPVFLFVRVTEVDIKAMPEAPWKFQTVDGSVLGPVKGGACT
jgi:hypothetical protein